MEDHRLIAQLMDPDEDVRAEAREELSMLMNDSIARAFLDVAAGQAKEEIRADAIVGLGPIIEEAGLDYEEGVDFGLAPELGSDISRETFDTIIREIRGLYQDESQPKLIRRRAFEVLVRDPQSWQADEIRKHFAGDDSQWKLTAVFGMGYVAGFENELVASLESADGPILYEAVRSAGSMEVEGAGKRIGEIARSESAETELRLVAIEALPRVDDDAEETLEALTESDDEEIAEAAEAALEDLSVGDAFDDE